MAISNGMSFMRLNEHTNLKEDNALYYDVARFNLWAGVFSLKLDYNVLDHIRTHLQIYKNDVEAGGQLFGRIEGTLMVCDFITGPVATDKRLRTFFQPNDDSEQADINAQFKKGRHYFGDWHTHPEDCPRPSRLDKKNFNRIVRESKRQLGGFIILIAGTEDPPAGLFLGVSKGHRVVPCKEA